MKRGFKRRYLPKDKTKRFKVIFSSFLFIFVLFTTLGYSIYREEISNALSLSINKPTFTITLDNQNANTAGTSTIYVKYGTGYYLDSNLSNKMTISSNGITIPQKNGLIFQGYYTETNGGGTQYIDKDGKITSSASTTHFSNNGTLYAYYINVKAENLSYDKTKTNVNCADSQCMIDFIANMLS